MDFETTPAQYQSTNPLKTSHPHTPEHVEYEELESNDIHQRLMAVMKVLVDEEFQDDITFKNMVGGVTNTLFKCTFKNNQGSYKSIIIRLYGKASECFIDRHQESYIQSILSNTGVGPRFYGTFNNGCIYGFVEGDQLQLEDLANDNILHLIAKETKKWHNLNLEIPREPTLISYMESWIAKTKELVPDQSKIGIDIEYYVKEANDLIKFLKQKYNQPHHIVFCHNDLIPRNMIYNKENDVVKYIDFEYSGYNYRGFDIGNFFCEFSGLDLDYTRYPSVDVQKQFIREYLKDEQQADKPIDEEEVHQLYIEANHFTLGSHLMWAFWGIISANLSTIDFDYIEYAKKRFQQYDRVKSKVFSLV